ncbi:MAG: hypothetical protein E7592_02795 [Ruminococcaceae bacterium]|nr:hypothetical protein [Oscillospiraceae bacterium]
MKFKIKKSGMLISVWVTFIALMAVSIVFIIIGTIDPRDEETKREEKLEELMEYDGFIACMRVVEKIYAENTFDVSDTQSITYVPCYVPSVNSSTGGVYTKQNALITVHTARYTKYYLYSPYGIQKLSDDRIYLYKQYTSGYIIEYENEELELMIWEATRNGID